MKRDDWLSVRNGIIEHLSEDTAADPLKRLAFAGRFGTEREEILEGLESSGPVTGMQWSSGKQRTQEG